MSDAMEGVRREPDGDWTTPYLSAPIWRFWIGPGIAGCSCLGAIMPSVDGVGRYHPLMLVGTWQDTVPPPEFETNEIWFAAAEQVLLDALGDGGSLDRLLEQTATLPDPVTGLPLPDPEAGVRGMFATLRHAQMRQFYGTLSCWWVPACTAIGPVPYVMLRQGLPRPTEYATMIRQGEPDVVLDGVGGH